MNNYSEIEIGNLLFGNSRGVYPVDRETYQEVFLEYLEEMGFESQYHDLTVWDGEVRKFENNTFLLRPYYWGDNEEIAELPNFVYKPTGLEIQWYKYPLRDSYSNQELVYEDFIKMMEDCKTSM